MPKHDKLKTAIVLLFFFFWILSNEATLADNGSNEGEELAKEMLNKGVISSTTTQAGDSTLTNLGISTHTVGYPSSDQSNDMGVSGKSTVPFNFLIHPKCNSTQYLLGLDGATITIVCQSSNNGQITAQVCFPHASQKSCETTNVNIPTDGKKLFSNGYEWQGLCEANGTCQGSMMLSGQVTVNADNLVSQGQKSQANSEAYQTIYEGYASDEGYNRTEAYIHSFESDGQNKWMPECMQHAEGFIKDGVFYSCDGQQQGDLYNSCKTVKECTNYEYKTVFNEVNKVCEIISSTMLLTCEQWPEVSIQLNDIAYPNCKNLIITQGQSIHCPNGYTEEVYGDMVLSEHTIRICTAPMDNGSCYTGGYYIATPAKPFFGNGQGILPKGLHGRLELNHVYNGNVLITLVNNTTGTTLVDHVSMGEGSVINLPFSYTEDQSFTFYISGKFYLAGVLTMLVDSHGQYKTSTITINQSCPLS